MIRWLAVFCALAFGASAAVAASTPFPKLYDVTGVAADDHLNVRKSPDASAIVLETFAHNQTGIEVIGLDESGNWGLVNSGETSGWVALQFLQPRPRGDTVLTPDLSCFGTEPFWSLRISQGQSATFSSPDGTAAPVSAGTLKSAFNHGDRYYLGLANGEYVIIRRVLCSDDMTNRAYGLEIDYLTANPLFNGQVLLTGCCSLVAD